MGEERGVERWGEEKLKLIFRSGDNVGEKEGVADVSPTRD